MASIVSSLNLLLFTHGTMTHRVRLDQGLQPPLLLSTIGASIQDLMTALVTINVTDTSILTVEEVVPGQARLLTCAEVPWRNSEDRYLFLDLRNRYYALLTLVKSWTLKVALERSAASIAWSLGNQRSTEKVVKQRVTGTVVCRERGAEQRRGRRGRRERETLVSS